MVLYWLVGKAVTDVLGRGILMIFIHSALYLLCKVGQSYHVTQACQTFFVVLAVSAKFGLYMGDTKFNT
jgi:hypothetical protein